MAKLPMIDDSSGGYGVAKNPDGMSMDAWLRAQSADVKEAIKNAIKNMTGALSPIGTSPQGNMSLQVPPMISGIADSYSRLAGTPSQPGNAYNLSGVPEFDAPIQGDMSNALLSLYGGNALNPLAKRPAGSVGAGARVYHGKPSTAAPAIATAGEQPRGVTAYHGSPHDFDKFSLDKIGTGEGAQAYGHGLYFADSEGVAKSYRESLTQKAKYGYAGAGRHHVFMVDGREVPVSQKSVADIAHMMRTYDIDPRTADGADWLEREVGDRGMPYETIAEATALAQKNIERKTVDGRMYQVRINAEPDQFLDWDKPLSQQSEAVRGAFEAKGIMPGNQTMYEKLNSDEWTALLRDRYGVEDLSDVPREKWNEAMDLSSRPVMSNYDPLGRDAFEKLAGGDANFSDHVSPALREAGIPGIRYLDGNSRGGAFKVDLETSRGPYRVDDPVTFSSREQAQQYADAKALEGFKTTVIDQGSRNYVVFDDSLIEILKKYGMAGGALGAGALAQPDQASAQSPDKLERLKQIIRSRMEGSK